MWHPSGRSHLVLTLGVGEGLGTCVVTLMNWELRDESLAGT